ncbi:MAG TPA: right-handed parallel beta-helix repeat-containing protein [Bryobacteraceae bacterium]|nr:right-handed parallel beta-helix repeat-containing protein [Bryobacteraceae bacterium]
MSTPTAVFPAAVATDSQLKVANNLIQTTLKVGVGTADTILFVNSTAGFTANCLVSIDKEILAIDSIVSGPNPQLIVNASGRGFDGTVAAVHSAGAKISMYIDAWHHNVLAAEVKAIEAALGPNLSKVGQSPELLTSQYNFAPQTPGGSLVVGSNSITLSPVPIGVNGTDGNHYLYISGGTGTAEAVPITGGTAVSGAASGTVIVTCANAHTGAWTIRSSSAGCMEALYSVGAGAPVDIRFPFGTVHLQATIKIATQSVTIAGGGATATTVIMDTPNIDIFEFDSTSTQGGNTLKDMQIVGQASSTSGAAIKLNNQSYTTISDLLLYHVSTGITISASVWYTIRYVSMAELNGGNGVLIGPGGNNTGIVERLVITSSTSFNAGIRITECGDARLHNCELVNGTYGLEIAPANGQTVASVTASGCFCDHNSSYGTYIHPATGGSVIKSRFNQHWGSSSGDGFHVDGPGTTTGVSLIDSQFIDGAGNGIVLNAGSSFLIQGCRIANNNGGTGVMLGVAIPQVIITGNILGNNIDGPGTGTQQYGIYAGAGLGSGSRIDNINKGHTVADLFLPTGNYPASWISGVGYDDQFVTIASAATLSVSPSFVPNVNLTGSTAVTAITAATWPGRTLRIYKTDAGSVTVLGRTIAQNGSYLFRWDGSAWN